MVGMTKLKKMKINNSNYYYINNTSQNNMEYL